MRYYYFAESFLFFTSRPVAANLELLEVQALRKLLIECLRERVGRWDDSFAVVMCALAYQALRE